MTKVLIVEDSQMIANAVKAVLENEGIEAVLSKYGESVIESVKKNNVDLIVLDLMMPGVSGVDILKSLKAEDDTKGIPVLILTAKTDAMKWNEDVKLCDKFMTKPFDNNELISNVKELLKKG